MTHFLFLLTIFILFIIEGTVLQVFSPDYWGMTVIMIPRFVVVMLIFGALFLGRFQGLFMGILFGLLYDVVYGSVLGVFGFSMALVGYFCGLTFRIFQQNIFLILCTVLIALILHEFLVYGVLLLIDFVQMDLSYFLFQRVIPTLVLNMIFAILVSYPARAILQQLQLEEEKS